MKQWFYARDGQQAGPEDEADLQRRFLAGELPPGTLVWASHLTQWTPAASVPEFASAWEGAGRATAGSQPPALAGAAVRYAGIGKRLAAGLIDAVVLNVAVLVLVLLLQPMDVARMQALGFIASWCYHASFECSSWQGSLGKMALGIRVTDLQGERIGFLRATGRHFGKLFSALTLMFGFLMIAFTEKRQGLHDMLSGCLVVDR